MNIKMKLKHLLPISLAVLLSACTNPNNNVPTQSNSGYNDEYQNQYQDTSVNSHTEALAVGAIGVGTGYALAKQANKPRYSKPSTVNGKPVVVVNKYYYQSGSRTKYKPTYRKRK